MSRRQSQKSDSTIPTPKTDDPNAVSLEMSPSFSSISIVQKSHMNRLMELADKIIRQRTLPDEADNEPSQPQNRTRAPINDKAPTSERTR